MIKTIRTTFFIFKKDYKTVKMISVCVEDRNNIPENIDKDFSASEVATLKICHHRLT